MSTYNADLCEKSEMSKDKLPVKIIHDNFNIEVLPKGYGTAGMEDGYGCPVFLERWEGELRVVVFADINSEDPTHIISLEGARESKRKQEE